MIISRRKLIGGTGAVILAATTRPAWASLLSDNTEAIRKILARHWTGGAVMKTSATESGELGIGLDYDLDTRPDLTFTGLCSITSTWGGTTYRAQYRMGGLIWGEGNSVGVKFDTNALETADALPSRLYWQALKGNLELLREEKTDDSWLLSGTLYGTIGGDAFKTQLSDHPV